MNGFTQGMGRIPVRARVTVSGDGSRFVDYLAFCPFEGRTMLSSECAACPAFQGLEVAHEDEPYVTCAAKAAQEAEEPELLTEVGEVPTSRPSAAAWTPALAAIGLHELVCFRPDVSTTLASSLLQSCHYGGAPVVDERGRVVGMVTLADLLRGFDRTEGPFSRVEGLMTPNGITLSEHVTVARAAGEMAVHKVHRIPLVNEEGNAVALITAFDVVRWLACHDGFFSNGQAKPCAAAPLYA